MSAKRNPVAKAVRLIRSKVRPSAKVYSRKGRGAAVAAIAISIGLAQCAPAMAVESGYELYTQCLSNGPGKLACLNYVRGVWDGLAAADLVKHTGFLCPDHTVTGGDMLSLFVNFARLHTNDLSNSAVSVVGGAYITAFPCGSK